MEQSDILRNLQIEQLTPMQEAARDAYQSNKDLVLLSPTGSGKTLAFLLPLVQSLKADVQGVQAVVLVPSRELALQIETVFKSMNVPFKAMSCYGGRPAMEEHRTMRGINPAVIIGTPGRMNDHLRKRNFEVHSVTTLVIDEFDKCLEFDRFRCIIGSVISRKGKFIFWCRYIKIRFMGRRVREVYRASQSFYIGFDACDDDFKIDRFPFFINGSQCRFCA